MNQSEINQLVGKDFFMHNARYICVATGDDALLFLQICAQDEPLHKVGDPVQYIVAHHPYIYEGKLVWGNGDYYPIFQYDKFDNALSAALWEAATSLNAAPLYVAMADGDMDECCLGVYTRRNAAERILEERINQDGEVLEFAQQYGKERFSFPEYRKLYDEHSLENCYWIEKRHINRHAE